MKSVHLEKRKTILYLGPLLLCGILLLPPVKTVCSLLMLKTTVSAVAFITDSRFEQAEENRFVNEDQAIILNRACSGYRLMVFNIAVWGAFAFVYKAGLKKTFLFPAAIPLYTLSLNVIRILLSIIIIGKEDMFPFLFEARYRIHEFMGILIILLSVLFLKIISSGVKNHEWNENDTKEHA